MSVRFPARTCALFIAFALTIHGCCPSVSSEDQERLRIVRKKYTGHEISLDCDQYLKVVQKVAAQDGQEDVVFSIARDFFLDSTGKMRNTSFQFANFYNSEGKWQYQLHCFSNGTFGKGDKEHY